MRKAISFFLVSAIVLGLAGCGPTVSAQVVKSDKARITEPAVEKADLDALVNSNNAFAFTLYQALRQAEGNLFYSPYSISEALGMTYAGARGDTEKSMAQVLNFTLSQDRLHPAFNSIDLQLAQRGQGAKGKDGEGFRLHVVNAIWGQKDYQFVPQFLDVLAQNYGTGLRILDFIKETEQSRITINDWVSQQTEQRIKDLVPPGAINTLTRLVLTNAIYFNAAWQYPFMTESTSSRAFNLLNGSSVMAPMMNQTEYFRYTEGADYQAPPSEYWRFTAGADYQAVELPYDGEELSMLILAPGAGQFDAFEKALTAGALEGIIGALATKRVALTMPKFEFESSFGLKKPLATMGMGVAFTTDADFSGIDGKRDLLIQDVLHKAFVSVDEAGTEAAAATAVIIGTTSMPPPPVELTLDRPFIFLIRDIPTGTTIFVGRVLNPTAN
ncbi:MAG TPA: serpin family protein [Dehalococcoidia bacterium]|nr:serpin family protein [Dehalococcoidia bacterium]